MTKPNAVEKIMANQVENSTYHAGATLSDHEALRIARECFAALSAAGLAIVPHDWNHREEDWSLESVGEWLTAALEESKEG